MDRKCLLSGQGINIGYWPKAAYHNRPQPIAATPQQLQSGKSYLPQTAPNADRLIVTNWIKASTE
jgi:hypothetical protein